MVVKIGQLFQNLRNLWNSPSMMVAIMSPNKAAMAAPTMTLVIPDIPHSPGPQQKAISLETVTMKWFNELFDHPTMTVATFFSTLAFIPFLQLSYIFVIWLSKLSTGSHIYPMMSRLGPDSIWTRSRLDQDSFHFQYRIVLNLVCLLATFR